MVSSGSSSKVESTLTGSARVTSAAWLPPASRLSSRDGRDARRLAALERVRGGEAYRAARARLDADNASEAHVKVMEEAKAAARARFLAKVPEEPKEGEAGSTWICIHVGAKEKVWRRFESCNTAADVLNFVRSLPAVNPDAALELKNVTTAPAASLSAPGVAGYTLQRLDLWPSGHIEAIEVR